MVSIKIFVSTYYKNIFFDLYLNILFRVDTRHTLQFYLRKDAAFLLAPGVKFSRSDTGNAYIELVYRIR